MATERPGTSVSFQAAADLSGQQFRFVKLDANGQVAAITATTDQAIGILQDKPAAQGRAANVMLDGRSKLVMGANVAKAGLIGHDNQGRGVEVAFGTANQSIYGQCVTDNSVAGGIGSVEFDCKNPARA